MTISNVRGELRYTWYQVAPQPSGILFATVSSNKKARQVPGFFVRNYLSRNNT